MAAMNMLLVSPASVVTSGYSERRVRSTSRLRSHPPTIVGVGLNNKRSIKSTSESDASSKAGGKCRAIQNGNMRERNTRLNERKMRPLAASPASIVWNKEPISVRERRRRNGEEDHLTEPLVVETPTTPMPDTRRSRRRGEQQRPLAAFAASSVIYYACIAALLVAAAAPKVAAERPDSQLCPLNEYIDDSDQTVQEFFECPGLEDPPDYKVCCDEKCCPLVEIDSVLRVDIRIAMIISLTVICICVALGVTLVLCCFISSCPLYDVCMGGWSLRDSERAPKDFPASFMGSGYVPSDMHPLTLNNGSTTSSSNGNGKISEKSHKIAPGVSPNEADHV